MNCGPKDREKYWAANPDRAADNPEFWKYLSDPSNAGKFLDLLEQVPMANLREYQKRLEFLRRAFVTKEGDVTTKVFRIGGVDVAITGPRWDVYPYVLGDAPSGGTSYEAHRGPRAWGEFARVQGEIWGWPYAHVLANAGITRDYGTFAAWSASLGKEWVGDLGKGIILGRQKNLYSFLQPIDFRMNAFGRQIGRQLRQRTNVETLRTRMEPFENYPEGAPGPLYGLFYGNVAVPGQ